MCAVKNLILICGDEEYLREQKKNELLAGLGCEGSMNYNVFTDDNIDPAEIRSLMNTMPFMEDKRTLLIAGSGYFKGQAGAELLETFESVPETSVVIFVEKDADRSNALYRLVSKNGEVFRFDSAESRSGRDRTAGKTEVRNWAREILGENGRKIDSRTLFDLAEMTGYDMQNLSTELEKLICYTWDRPGHYVITKEDIDAVCSRTLADRVFDMVDLKIRGKTAEAVRLLEELYALRVPAMRILYVMVRQYNQALAFTECRQAMLGDAETARVLGVGSWLVDRLKKQLTAVTPEELRHRLEMCADMEYRVKTGDMPEKLAVELLLIC